MPLAGNRESLNIPILSINTIYHSPKLKETHLCTLKVSWLYKESLVSVSKSRSVKKKMVAIFHTARSIVKSIILDSQKTVTGKRYTEESIPKVVTEARNFTHVQDWTFSFPTIRMLLSIRSQTCVDYLGSNILQLSEHSFYRLDLVACEFALFFHMKNKIKGSRSNISEHHVQCIEKPK